MLYQSGSGYPEKYVLSHILKSESGHVITLNLEQTTPQNGQIHSNNSLSNSLKGWRLKG